MSGNTGGSRRTFTRVMGVIAVVTTAVLLAPAIVVACWHINDHPHTTNPGVATINFLGDMHYYRPIYIWVPAMVCIMLIWGVGRPILNAE